MKLFLHRIYVLALFCVLRFMDHFCMVLLADQEEKNHSTAANEIATSKIKLRANRLY